MGREIAWRRGCPVLVTQRLKQLRTLRLYIVAQRGPTAFTLKVDDRKFTCSLGSVHECSCADSKNELCVHLLFLLARVYRIPTENALLWQRSMLEAEINFLLDGRKRALKYEEEARTHAATQREQVAPKPLEGECPICCDTLSAADSVLFCHYSCGQPIHSACFREYVQHQDPGSRVLCPLCRAPWSEQDYDVPKYPPNTRCDGCSRDIVHGERYRCSFCSRYDLCPSCYNGTNIHRQHPYFVQNGPKLPFLPAQERPPVTMVLATAAAAVASGGVSTTPNHQQQQQVAVRSPAQQRLHASLSALLEQSSLAPSFFSPAARAIAVSDPASSILAAASGGGARAATTSDGSHTHHAIKTLSLNEVMDFSVDVNDLVAMRVLDRELNPPSVVNRRFVSGSSHRGNDDDDDDNMMMMMMPPESLLGLCHICLGDLDGVNGFLMRLPCPCSALCLLLHSSCAAAWLCQGSATCPRCNAPVAPDRTTVRSDSHHLHGILLRSSLSSSMTTAAATGLNAAAGSAVALLRARDRSATNQNELTPPRRNGLVVGMPLSDAARQQRFAAAHQNQPTRANRGPSSSNNNSNSKYGGGNNNNNVHQYSREQQSAAPLQLLLPSVVGHAFVESILMPPSPPSARKMHSSLEERRDDERNGILEQTAMQRQGLGSGAKPNVAPAAAVMPTTFEWRRSVPSIPSRGGAAVPSATSASAKSAASVAARQRMNAIQLQQQQRLMIVAQHDNNNNNNNAVASVLVVQQQQQQQQQQPLRRVSAVGIRLSAASRRRQQLQDAAQLDLDILGTQP